MKGSGESGKQVIPAGSKGLQSSSAIVCVQSKLFDYPQRGQDISASEAMFPHLARLDY